MFFVLLQQTRESGNFNRSRAALAHALTPRTVFGMPKIVRFHQIGGPEVLQLEELPAPRPEKGEVRIKVEAIGLNRAEVMFRNGKYIEEPELPSRLGYEASGIVEEVGPGVTGWKPGDRVSSVPSFSMRKYFTYGEVALLPAYALAKYPENLSPIEGASIWMQYLTAYGLIEFGKMQHGHHVLITAAASSVGLAAIELANAVGAIPIATTRNEAKEAPLRRAGAKFVVNTKTEGWVEKVREITAGEGVDLAFDPVAGSELETRRANDAFARYDFRVRSAFARTNAIPVVYCYREKPDRPGLHACSRLCKTLNCSNARSVGSTTGWRAGSSSRSSPAPSVLTRSLRRTGTWNRTSRSERLW